MAPSCCCYCWFGFLSGFARTTRRQRETLSWTTMCGCVSYHLAIQTDTILAAFSLRPYYTWYCVSCSQRYIHNTYGECLVYEHVQTESQWHRKLNLLLTNPKRLSVPPQAMVYIRTNCTICSCAPCAQKSVNTKFSN